VNTGGLLVAAAFLTTLAGKTCDPEPAEFLETIAVANFGKFAIDAPRNIDYADWYERLEASLPYIAEDLLQLRPGVVLVANTTARTLRKRGQRSFSGVPRLVPAMQCQGHNFGRCRRKYAARAAELETTYGAEPWASWIPQLGSRVRPSIWPYLAEVEEGWNAGAERS